MYIPSPFNYAVESEKNPSPSLSFSIQSTTLSLPTRADGNRRVEKGKEKEKAFRIKKGNSPSMLKSVQESRKSGTYRIVCYARVKYNILPLAGNWRISLRVFPTHNNLSAKQVGRCRCRSGKDRLTSNDRSRVQSRASFLLIFGEKETSGETEKRKITILFSFHFSCTDGFVGKKRLVHSRSNMLGKAILLPPSNSERSNSQIKKAMLSAEQRRFSPPLDGQKGKK